MQTPSSRTFVHPPALLRFLSLFLALTVLAVACTRDDGGDTPVAWPELVRFDEVAYRADSFARTGDLATVEEMRAELLETGKAITPATIPSNVADPRQTKTILADLTGLVDGLSRSTDPKSTATLVLGMHPVIEKLMDAAGMPHIHANEGPNSGFLQPVFDSGGEQIGTAEIKLHDDAGNLEIWLTQGGYGGQPWRVNADTTLAMTFPDLERELTLAVRDQERNEDESGNVTILNGATNYFIFPGETGTDAAWLMGPDFAARAELRIVDSTTGPFILRPHVHRESDDVQP